MKRWKYGNIDFGAWNVFEGTYISLERVADVTSCS